MSAEVVVTEPGQYVRVLRLELPHAGRRQCIDVRCTEDMSHFLVRSATKAQDDSPRFALPIPVRRLNDPGIRLLAKAEELCGGFQFPLRSFLERHLRAGDVFVDVGAHWGLFSLDVATGAFGAEIDVLAIEPHPENQRWFEEWMRFNGIARGVEFIQAAAGRDTRASVPLFVSTSMGHRLAAARESLDEQTVLHVPQVSLDDLFAERPRLAARRVLLKIDVEGAELEVLHGAEGLLAQGRVAAVLWEKGHGYGAPGGRARLAELTSLLGRYGFRHLSVPHVQRGGALIPFFDGEEAGDVISLSAGLVHDAAYSVPEDVESSFLPQPCRTFDDDERIEFIERLRELGGTDGWRWAMRADLEQGARSRAEWAAPRLRACASVLDLGAGARELERLLPEGTRYTPVDLIRFGPGVVELDLNQRGFPSGRFDAVVVLQLLEHLHDPRWTLARARETCGRLVGSYALHASGTAIRERRLRGFFNDFDHDALLALLQDCGWSPSTMDDRTERGTLYFDCE